MIDDLYPPPPWRWEARAALWRYWVRDPAEALQDLALHNLMRPVPLDTVSAIGGWLGRRAGRKRAVASRRARELLRRLRPEADDATIEALLAAHWDHVGRCFAEYSVPHRTTTPERLAIEGGEILRGILAEGRPLLIAGTHIGHWEMVPAALARLRIPFHGIFQALPNRFRMRIAAGTRITARNVIGEPAAVPILPTLAAPFQAHRVLESREGALLYFVDENWGGRVQAPALGRPLRMEGNIMRAVRLAQRTGAAVVPAYALRLDGAARFRTTFLPEVKLGPPGRGRAGILEDIAALDAVLERLVRAHPEQWFMLNSFRPDR